MIDSVARHPMMVSSAEAAMVFLMRHSSWCDYMRAERGPSPRVRVVIDSLTPREREVLMLMLRARSTKEIAHALHLSIDTVKTYIKRIIHAFDASGRAEVMAACLGSDDLIESMCRMAA